MKSTIKWISVDEKLPENYTPVLVYIPTKQTIYQAYMDEWMYRLKISKTWFSSEDIELENNYGKVTHWAEMPKFPQEEE